jgi:hypothetical protein
LIVNFVFFQVQSERLTEQLPNLDSLEVLQEELGFSISPEDHQYSSLSVWKLRQDLCLLESR